MKKLLLFLLLLTCRMAFAQTETLATDEHNKFIIYKVEEVPGARAATMFSRCLAGLNKNYKSKDVKVLPLSADTTITVKGKTVIYSSQSTVRHEDGEMSYVLHIEFKDGKYRYWFTDFVFAQYQRNRYGVFEPVPGNDVKLEQLKEKAGGKKFDEYADQLTKYCAAVGKNLKIYAAEPEKPAGNEKKVDTRKW